MKRSGQLSFDATLPGMSSGIAELVAQFACCCSPQDCNAAELGISELLSNIARHGYGGKAGTVSIKWAADASRMVFRIIDTGIPIPPGALENAAKKRFDFDAKTDIAQLPEFGMGLFLVQQSFQKVRYRSCGGVNRFVAIRRLTA
jgi:serine/threonine-protein kinase RsbW